MVIYFQQPNSYLFLICGRRMAQTISKVFFDIRRFSFHRPLHTAPLLTVSHQNRLCSLYQIVLLDCVHLWLASNATTIILYSKPQNYAQWPEKACVHPSFTVIIPYCSPFSCMLMSLQYFPQLRQYSVPRMELQNVQQEHQQTSLRSGHFSGMVWTIINGHMTLTQWSGDEKDFTLVSWQQCERMKANWTCLNPHWHKLVWMPIQSSL